MTIERRVHVESELVWRGWGTIPIGTLGDRPRSDARLPSTLVTIAAALEQFDSLHVDLAKDVDLAAAWRLTTSLWDRARVLAAEGRISEALPSNVRELGRVLEPRAVVKIIATVVATGLAYTDDPLPEAPPLSRAWSVVRAIGGARRVPQSIRFAEQAVSARRELARCVQFATATRVLFYALKRATGAPTNVFLPSVYGRGADLDSEMRHAWNWFVDANTGSIAALDVSAASRASHDFQVDLGSYSNASAFLGSAYNAAINPSRPAAERDNVRELLAATVDPRTERGQFHLFHIADHRMTPFHVRRWIVGQLEKHSFACVVPDFKHRLTRDDESRGLLDRLLDVSLASASDVRLFDGLA